MRKDRPAYNFKKLYNIVSRNKAPLYDDSYLGGRRGYRHRNAVSRNFTLEEIQEIIREGDLNAQRELSRYFYRTNGEYRNNIDFLASLPLYDTVVVPIIDKKGSETQIINNFKEACEFIDNLDVPNTFNHITKEWLKTGVYNGILRQDGKFCTIQDLPFSYCRTRFKDFHNLNILEFNLLYFDKITDAQDRAEILLTFPLEVQQAWTDYCNHKLESPWVMIPAESGGVCFMFTDDPTPLLLASIPQLKKLEDAVNREEKRDENELYKLLIQKMPIDKDGELVFELDEVEDIHKSVANMLADIDTVDVLTTFGDTSLENLQETTGAQTINRIEKYKDNAYDALGRSSLIFNADGSSTLAYSIKKDESLMISYLNVYETWLKFNLNYKFSRIGLTFDFEILPTTVFNRKDIESSKFNGAKYGFSKLFAGVALGIKQRDLISLMDFENDYLKMSEKMIPLQSSYTTSGAVIAGEEKNNESAKNTDNNASINDLENKGGRPELPDEEKSEKTQANIAAMN